MSGTVERAVRARLLVVDDEEPQRLMLEGILARAGFDVVTAAPETPQGIPRPVKPARHNGFTGSTLARHVSHLALRRDRLAFLAP